MKKEKIFLAAAPMICAAAVCVMIYVIISTVHLENQQKFIPPAFEKQVQTGMPQPSEDLGYTTVTVAEGYEIGLCSNPTMSDAELQVWFTSPDTNQVWMRLQVCDSDGEVLGETGVIRPGEYVESIQLARQVKSGEEAVFRITGYTPETWHSAGNAELPVTLYGYSE